MFEKDILFEDFKSKVKESITTTIQSLGLPIIYRQNAFLSYIRYPKYLIPALSKLPNEVFKEIQSSRFSLKPIDKIITDAIEKEPKYCAQNRHFLETVKKNYSDIFDFDKHGQECCTMGNSNQDVNLLRCLYDFSVRYRKDQNLLTNCQYLISGVIKVMGAEMGLRSVNITVEVVKNFLEKIESSKAGLFNSYTNGALSCALPTIVIP